MILKALALFALLAAEPAWDVSQPRGKVREIDFTTREGTWMSLDLSPDGKWIVFDLLGHVYRLPAAGGEAECLTQASGVALNIHPRFSPDGRQIAFVSDRGGHPHLWVMNLDGSDPRKIPTDPRYRLLQPAWSPDGKHLFAIRWDGIYRISLEGKEEQLVEAPAEWPSPSRDGRYLYYQALTPLEDSNEIRGDLLDGRRLRRLELATGKAEDVPVAALPGGAIAPEISPDGRRLAFVRRVKGGATTWRGHAYAARTALRVRDLETGDERVVLEPAETDLSTIFDGRRTREMPGYAWSADGSSILLTQGGQIRRLRVSDGHVETVPFTARVRRTISQQADASHRIDDGPLRVRMLRWHSASPDGSRLAFQALNKIWVTGADGTPRRLTPEGFTSPEWTPSWSPDDRWIAFTTWDQENRGHLWKIPAEGGEPVRLTGTAGEYLHPVWTPDGRELLIVRGVREASALTWADNTGYELTLLPAGGGELKVVTGSAGPGSSTSPTATGARSSVPRSVPRAGSTSPSTVKTRAGSSPTSFRSTATAASGGFTRPSATPTRSPLRPMAAGSPGKRATRCSCTRSHSPGPTANRRSSITRPRASPGGGSPRTAVYPRAGSTPPPLGSATATGSISAEIRRTASWRRGK